MAGDGAGFVDRRSAEDLKPFSVRRERPSQAAARRVAMAARPLAVHSTRGQSAAIGQRLTAGREETHVNKSQLGARVADAASMSRAGADTAVGAVFAAIADALARGETVAIAGFGKFAVRRRPARTGRNPQTGEPVAIAASRAPSFKPAKALRDAVNG